MARRAALFGDLNIEDERIGAGQGRDCDGHCCASLGLTFARKRSVAGFSAPRRRLLGSVFFRPSEPVKDGPSGRSEAACRGVPDRPDRRKICRQEVDGTLSKERKMRAGDAADAEGPSVLRAAGPRFRPPCRAKPRRYKRRGFSRKQEAKPPWLSNAPSPSSSPTSPAATSPARSTRASRRRACASSPRSGSR